LSPADRLIDGLWDILLSASGQLRVEADTVEPTIIITRRTEPEFMAAGHFKRC